MRTNAMVGSSLRTSGGQDGARADSWGAVDVGEGGSGVAGDLAGACLAAQLQDALVDLAEAGGADGLAVGEAAAVGVHGNGAADLGGSFLDELLLVAVVAQAALGEMDELRAGLGVLKLGD